MAAIDSARISLATGIAVLGLKFLAYYWTGSVALYSDALESFVNVAGALAALAALIVAIRPADSRHPYGHAKAEYFSAVFEGVLIVVAALTIIQESWPRLFHPQAVTGLDWGIAASILASTLNAALARYLVHQGDRLSSPALRADGLHIWSDVVTSVGVLIGIGLAVWTGWWLLDPLLAVLVALNILWVGGGLIRDSLGGLMDESLPEEDLTRVKTLVKDAMTGALEIHSLKSRRAGPAVFLEFHLVVPSAWTVGEAHGLCDRIESLLATAYPAIQISIHVEPEGEARERKFVLTNQ